MIFVFSVKRAGRREPETGGLCPSRNNHLKKIETWLEQQPNMSTLFISYNQILHDPEPDLNRLKKFLGGNLDIKRMLQVVDKNLYRERRLA